MLDFQRSTYDDFYELGRWLWQESGQYSTHEAISQFVVETLYREFVVDGNPQLALVRVFRLVHADDLPTKLRALVPADDHYVFTLTGSYGMEANWCHRTRSAAHQAISLNRIAFTDNVPMFLDIFDQLSINMDRLRDAGEVTMHGYKGSYYIPDAPQHNSLADQDNFIVPYGIRSVIGFGGHIQDLNREQSLFILAAFARVPITADAADHFLAMQDHVAASLASREGHTSVFDE